MKATGRDFRTFHRFHHCAGTREAVERELEHRRESRVKAVTAAIQKMEQKTFEVKAAPAKPRRVSFISRVLRFVSRRRS